MCTGIVVVSVALTGMSAYRMETLTKHNLIAYQASLIASYDQMIKGQVQAAVGVLSELERRVRRGELTPEEARRQGALFLRTWRYGNDGYFWGDTVGGVNVFHGNDASIEGKNRLNSTDVSGRFLIREIIENGRKEGGGFTEFWFSKPGKNRAFLKRGYSLEFRPWGWVIGTGNYLDDIQNVLDGQRRSDARELDINLTYQILFSVAATSVSVVAACFWVRRFTRPLKECVAMARRIADGDLDTDVAVVSDRDEVGQLAEAMNEMLAGLRATTELRRLARTDALTDANNRRFFLELLDEALHVARINGTALTLLMFDLDYFKLINDTYGHAVGDDVLRMVSKVVQSFGLRQTDFWGRLGGEEFAVVLRDTPLASAAPVVERLRRALSEPEVSYGNGCFQVTASIGVAESRPGDDSSMLLKRADSAMYRAKADGRNRACFATDDLLDVPAENGTFDRHGAGKTITNLG